MNHVFFTNIPIITIAILIFNSNIYFAQNHELYDDLIYISNYINSPEAVNLKSSPDIWLDSLFSYTKRYKKYDISETLFLLTFATLQFREMPLSIPVIGGDIYLPLPRPPDSLFYSKNNNIPKRFFSFSPKTDSDRDKYSHFFGNAFISFNSRIFNFSKIMGIFVEYFEDTFKVEGAVDNKDLFVNDIGFIYGQLLNENDKLLPSDVIKTIELLNYIDF